MRVRGGSHRVFFWLLIYANNHSIDDRTHKKHHRRQRCGSFAYFFLDFFRLHRHFFCSCCCCCRVLCCFLPLRCSFFSKFSFPRVFLLSLVCVCVCGGGVWVCRFSFVFFGFLPSARFASVLQTKRPKRNEKDISKKKRKHVPQNGRGPKEGPKKHEPTKKKNTRIKRPK